MSHPAGLPPGVSAYRRTPVFDQDTIPKGLLQRHSTRAGVWGVISVLEGRLRFRLLDPPSETVLEPGRPAIVAPEQPHQIAAEGAVRFFVEFYRAGEGGASDADGADGGTRTRTP